MSSDALIKHYCKELALAKTFMKTMLRSLPLILETF